jgi:hypothetical protein
MKNVLREDMWTLDFAAAAIFAMAMAAEFQILSDDSGEEHLERILPAAGIALLSYTFAFLLGIAVRKRISFVRSWVWMSLVGAGIYTAVVVISAYPMWEEYERRFHPGSGLTLGRYLHNSFLPWLAYFLMWAIPMAAFLIVVRSVFALGKHRLK